MRSVLLVAPHAADREELIRLLRGIEPPLAIREARDCEEALRWLEARADVDQVFVDPGSRGSALESLVLLPRRYPDVPVVVLSSSDPRIASAPISAGIIVFIPGQSPGSSLRAALDLARGECRARSPARPADGYLGDGPAQHAGDDRAVGVPKANDHLTARLQKAGLTPREQQVLVQAMDGAPYKTVAASLAIAEQTVRHHMSRCFRKLNVRTREQLIAVLAKDR